MWNGYHLITPKVTETLLNISSNIYIIEIHKPNHN